MAVSNRAACPSNPLHQIGEIPRRFRSPYRLRASRRPSQRDGLQAQFLHLIGKLRGGELVLRDHPGATGLRHLAGIGRLVIVGC